MSVTTFFRNGGVQKIHDKCTNMETSTVAKCHIIETLTVHSAGFKNGVGM